MTCPHCLVAFYPNQTSLNLANDADWSMIQLQTQRCPACGKLSIHLQLYAKGSNVLARTILLYPKAISRKSFTSDVDEKYKADYEEACFVQADSPKASAALSRRCLQNVLRDKAGVKPQDLSKEIDEVLASRQLPSHLANAIDAVRAIGNFGAHPIKSTSTGSIVDVEPGEAEWLLDVLEGLFDFYFVQPAETQRKRDALNKKLQDTGKPPLK